MNVSPKHPLDGDADLACRALPARAVRFAGDQILSMYETRAGLFGPNVALGLPSDAMGGHLRDEKLMPYPDEDHHDDWDFAVLHADPDFHVRASFRRHFDTFRELCRSANVAVPKDASSVFSLALQNVNAIKGYDSAVTAKSDALERVRVVEETAAGSLTVCTLEKIYIVHERDEGHATLERLKNDLRVLNEQISACATCSLSFMMLKKSSRFKDRFK